MWKSDSLPDSVPDSYSLSDIAALTRGYISGYPTFPAEAESGLLVVGFPKTSFWKHLWPSWDYQLIAHAPQIALAVLTANLAVLLLIYGMANAGLLRSVKPITNGILSLPSGEPVHLQETGPLSEVAAHINSASEVLQEQKRQLRMRETARANWIAGVSHDIRTPLSMVTGYADQLRSAPELTEENRKKAAIILKQSQRIRDLISDLNLASRLEYNMQPLRLQEVNAVSLVRQTAVDFMNADTEEKYSIEWQTEEDLLYCPVRADQDLLKRAVSNLILNSMKHNEGGCTIFLAVARENRSCIICVADNGIGVSEEQMHSLRMAPDHIMWDTDPNGQRHGLGLQIVRQIAASHQGITECQ